ncbi:MAG: hypothetical protein LBL59_09355 [Xanthomonadaceae bacterium]|jgi:alpha-tubulin suppressor-like RCC1 family protein|nr:hypothetical protein [Xanthomonadaceae bacterium]
MKNLLKGALLVSCVSMALVAHAQSNSEQGLLSPTGLITTGAAITEGGKAMIWGFRGSAQQGNGVTAVSSSAAPTAVKSLNDLTNLATGAYHLIARDSSGNVYGWGQSGYGETGCTGFYVNTPCKVMGNVQQIAAGEYFSVAMTYDGGVYTWGHNLYGQLGNGASKNSSTPVKVNLNGETARVIGGAYEGAFAVTYEGHVWAWGDNEASGLGFQGSNYGVQRIVRTPTRATALEPFANHITYIAGGNGWGEALLDDGRVIGWGVRASLGVGVRSTSSSSPTPVVIMDNVKKLFARYVGSFALTEGGTLGNDVQMYTWGQTGGSAFPMIYGDAPTLHYQRAAGDIVAIGGGKEHLFYMVETNTGKQVYGVGYNDLYKLNQSKCCAPNIEFFNLQRVVF